MNANSDSGRVGPLGLNGVRIICADLRTVVVTVIVVLVPAATDAGLNDAAAPAGNPEAVNVTIPGNVPPTDAVEIVTIPDWPAGNVCVVGVAITEKSVIVTVSEFDVPPPGAGLTTVTAAVPEMAMSLAVIAAVNCVALTKVVVRALPFHWATDVLMKFVPFSVRVKAGPPAPVDVGASEVSVGTGLFVAVTLKLTAFDEPPPGAGFVTVTGGVPTVATSPAGIAAVTCIALTNVVTLALPLKFTTELAIKLVPFTVSVNAPEPATALDGCKVVIVGTGFVPVMVNVTAFDVPPAGVGFVTVTGGVPTAATSPARIAAVNCVALTNVVTFALPLKFTTDVFRKFVPLTVRVKAPDPAAAVDGWSVVTVGTGLLAAAPAWFTVNVEHPAVIVSVRGVVPGFFVTA